MQNKRLDKYKAIWMSHSSLCDYEKCPRLYYLHNVYKDSKTGRKINIASPYTTLGIAVHNVLENLINFKSEDRAKQDLLKNYEIEWQKIVGDNFEMGGFESLEQEKEFKNRGMSMLKNVMSDYKMLTKKTIPTKSYYDGYMLPNYYISEQENIILCGNIDWIEYDEQNKNLKLIDFKTGKNEEKEDSIQLPIYKLLLTNLQKRWPVENGYYWYLDNENKSENLKEKILSTEILEDTKNRIIKNGVEIRDKRFAWSDARGEWIKLKNEEENFTCSGSTYCDCKKYQRIIDGEAKYLGVDMYGKDLYKI